jgi:hypothetical protein
MLERVVSNIDSRLQRKLLDVGVWTTGEPGLALTREGQSVNELVYLASGEALITFGRRGHRRLPRGRLHRRDDGPPQDEATGTAVVSKPTRYWAADARVLRQLCHAEPEILSALRSSFARNLREKLIASNLAALETLQDPAPEG